MQMWSGDSAASAELLPGPVPSTAPIRLRHSAGGSSHPALVTMGGGGLGGSPIGKTAAERAIGV